MVLLFPLLVLSKLSEHRSPHTLSNKTGKPKKVCEKLQKRKLHRSKQRKKISQSNHCCRVSHFDYRVLKCNDLVKLFSNRLPVGVNPMNLLLRLQTGSRDDESKIRSAARAPFSSRKTR